MRPRAIVIGGGPAGIRAAHLLAKGGLETTLLETAPVLGGLASSFDVQGVTIERYYHFICKGDDDLVQALGEIGLTGKLHWKSSRMAYFVDGTLYPFLTPLELLRFRALPPVDRLRAGIAVKLAQRMKERDLAPQRATEWLRRVFGARGYEVIWEPLMRFKFAEHADAISAAWIWARMVRLGRSRQSAWREELGYIEGSTIKFEERWPKDVSDRVPEQVRELLALDVRVIVAQGPIVPMVRRLVQSTPVVFGYSGDPVEAGLVESFSRPGGNFTGGTFMSYEVNAKRLEILHEAFPQIGRVGILSNPLHPGEPRELKQTLLAAEQRGLKCTYVEKRSAAELTAAFERLDGEGTNALMLLPDSLAMNLRMEIIELAGRRRWPSVSGWALFARSGGTIGLLMCGPLASAMPHQAMAHDGSSSVALVNDRIASSWLKANTKLNP